MEKRKNYNIGLDIGTSSVGWSVVECDNQKVMRKGNKKLWGVRLFDIAKTASETREFRSTRRRYERRKERIKLLQEEFCLEINKIDPLFFQKLRESKYHEKDNSNKLIQLTKEEKDKIKQYNDKYKTIYHLRNRLIVDSSKEDIRLVYLAIHHIIKYRGNFLYDKNNFSVDNLNIKEKIIHIFLDFNNLITEFNFPDNYLELLDIDNLEKILLESSKNDLKINLIKELSKIDISKNFSSELAKAVSGSKFSIKGLFFIEEIEKDIQISFSGNDFDDKYDEIEQILGEKIELLIELKDLYNIVFLKKLFRGYHTTSISEVMVEKYQKHSNDLKILKQLFTGDRKLYHEIFKSKKEKCLYERYITNKISFDEFKRELEKSFSKLFDNNIDIELLEKYNKYIKIELENGTFLPRITDTENGKYPYQLNREELIKIIKNQGKYYPFLLNKIGNEYCLVKLLEFKIPYYVGPLVSEKNSRFAWMERKINHVKITPYNFDLVIDKEKTAEKFIKRMISHCTYLLDEYALPNSSILYSKYKVMNELKQIKVNGEKLSLELQHQIMDELFKTTSGSITNKKFQNYLYQINAFPMYGTNMIITGYSSDEKFANNMQSYFDFFGPSGIFSNTSYTEEDADEIIEWVTIFEDKDILINKIKNKYHELNEQEIKKIATKKYSGWGNLSRKLLTTKYYKDKETNIYKSIMDLLYETNENFMQIINNDKYNFQEMIKINNVTSTNSKISYDLVSSLPTSPAIKKGIYQSLKVINEIVNYIGYEPKNIMIEMAREDGKSERTVDRKKYLLNLYQNISDSTTNYSQLINQLNEVDKIDKQKMLLYFMQEGKCLYCGNPLNIEDLNQYEVDHIIPRTLIKDDSIDNKAIVHRNCNQIKAANFILPKEYRKNYQIEWWKHLKKYGLMSSKKFYSLTRNEYKEEDIQGFIHRQLVETRQITKHIANVLSNLHPKSKIIYLKAKLSHDYREKYELYKYRTINDYHHAHDAYLAAVLGEFKNKYMNQSITFPMIQEFNFKLKEMGMTNSLKYGYVINSLDERVNDIQNNIFKTFIDIETGEVLFDSSKFNKNVANAIYSSDIMISRKNEIRTGKFYKETIFPRKKGNIKLKDNMPTELYGGYSNVETSYLILIEYNQKRKLIGIPIEIALKSKKNPQLIHNFILEHLNIKEYTILKNYIPYETLIHYKNQDVYIKGYSIAHKACEVSNAYQLKIPKNLLYTWRYTLNKIINKKDVPFINDMPALNDDKLKEQAVEILNFLLDSKNKYPLFYNEINKIENKINIVDKSFDEISKIILEIFKIYNGENGNLKEFGLGDRIGRLSGKNLNSGTLRFKSVTGIFETSKDI